MTIFRSEMGAEHVIRIVAAVAIDERGRTLLVRKRGTSAFMQPGGKFNGEETAAEALRREIREELGCDICVLSRLGHFEAPAANEPGWAVNAELFAVELLGEIVPAAEIEEAVWHDVFELSARTLAPLTREHVLPLIRTARNLS